MARSDGDTWDIVTSVGYTALAVCAARALDAALDPPLANDGYAAGFVTAAGEPTLAAAIATADVTGAVGFNAAWVGVRTRFFDDFFTRAAESGVRQAVILAAGLDARAYRLAWPPGSTVFEVDQPQVLDFKQQVLDQSGAVPAARRVAVPADLREDWPAVLRAADFDPAQPTAWALEGLLPYLPGPAQDSLFETLHGLSAVGSHVAVELGPNPGQLKDFEKEAPEIGDPQIRVADLWYDDPRRDTKAWLTDQEWAVANADLIRLAADEYGRPFQGLPPAFEETLRSKFFTAVRMH